MAAHEHTGHGPSEVSVADVVAVLEAAYPPRLAESWDAVGLVCGDPSEPAGPILVCVDVTDDVVAVACAQGYRMIVAHHPLLLRGVESVAADTHKGRIVHRLIRAASPCSPPTPTPTRPIPVCPTRSPPH